MKVDGSIAPFSIDNPQYQASQKPQEKKLVDRVKEAVFSNPMKSLFVGSLVVGSLALTAYFYASNPHRPPGPTRTPTPSPTPSPSGAPTSTPTPTPAPSPKPQIPLFCQIPSDLRLEQLTQQLSDGDYSLLNCNAKCPQDDVNKVYRFLNDKKSPLPLSHTGTLAANCLNTNHSFATTIVEKYIRQLKAADSQKDIETAGKFVQTHLTHPAVQGSITNVVEALQRHPKKIDCKVLVRQIRESCTKLTQNDPQNQYWGCANLVR